MIKESVIVSNMWFVGAIFQDEIIIKVAMILAGSIITFISMRLEQ